VSVTLADSMPALAAAASADCTATEVEFDAGVVAGAGVAVGEGVVGVAVVPEQPAKTRTAMRVRARFIYSISQFGPIALIGTSVNTGFQSCRIRSSTLRGGSFAGGQAFTGTADTRVVPRTRRALPLPVLNPDDAFSSPPDNIAAERRQLCSC
jgi:hypothetical protein